MRLGVASDKMKNGLCVLITNAFMKNWTGSELYLRDVAVELLKRGHKPVVYSPRTGELAEQLRSKSIPVVADLSAITVKPDLIHGQHHLETMTALAYFPGTPAVYFCHGWLPWEEIPPLHPRIMQYVAVSDALHDRLAYECGIPAEKVTTILNSVDLERFRPRPPLPVLPKRALVFNNVANETNMLGIIRKACAQNGIALEAMGYQSLNPSISPEEQLGNFDIIFGVGRAALEGLATGAAVICCGLEGVGQMVTTQNLELMRRNNFGIRVLNRPLSAEILSEEIRRYDPQDALKVSKAVRATAGLSGMIDKILDAYDAALGSWAKNPQPDPAAESLAFAIYLKGISEKVYQEFTDNEYGQERIKRLQGELDILKSSSTWKLYQRITRISFLSKSYMQFITPIRNWRARRRK